jgi:hypothetical protein
VGSSRCLRLYLQSISDRLCIHSPPPTHTYTRPSCPSSELSGQSHHDPWSGMRGGEFLRPRPGLVLGTCTLHSACASVPLLIPPHSYASSGSPPATPVKERGQLICTYPDCGKAFTRKVGTGVPGVYPEGAHVPFLLMFTEPAGIMHAGSWCRGVVAGGNEGTFCARCAEHRAQSTGPALLIVPTNPSALPKGVCVLVGG